MHTDRYLSQPAHSSATRHSVWRTAHRWVGAIALSCAALIPVQAFAQAAEFGTSTMGGAEGVTSGGSSGGGESGAIASPLGAAAPTTAAPSPLSTAQSQLGPNGVPTLVTGPKTETAQAQTGALPLPAAGMNEFQKFVYGSTGTALPMFGTSLFRDIPSSFAPVQNIPASANYSVGPGDELLIRVWGSIDFNLKATVDRNGQISIPKIGTFTVAGIKAGDLNAFIKSQIATQYKGFSVDVTLGQLRSIQVYVVGHVRRPGTYTLSSLSTLINALFASGGPSATGTMRHILVKRGGAQVADFDLYDFINNGDSAADIRLQAGDVVVVPPIGPTVALLGNVNTPAIYELKGPDSTIADLLRWNGGLPVTATRRVATLERIKPDDATARSVDQIALDGKGLGTTLRNGDVLHVYEISPKFGNVVTLRGNVASPMRVRWFPGMRIRDLIPNRDALIIPDYYIRSNHLALAPAKGTEGIIQRVHNTANEVDWQYAAIERLNPKTLQTELIPFNLGKAVLQDDPASNLPLQPGDVVTIFSKSEVPIPQAQQTRLVTIAGEVNNAGVYQLTPGETLHEAIRQAGGITPQAYLYGLRFTRVQTQQLQQQRLNEAVRRLQSQLQSESSAQIANSSSASDQAARLQQLQLEQATQQEQLRRLKQLRASGRISLELGPRVATVAELPDLPLENGDTVTIPARSDFVLAIGAVNNNNAVLWRPGRTVGDLLQIAGPTSGADLHNAFLLRADGTVIGANQMDNSWFESLGAHFASIGLMPGDTLVIPEKLDQRSAYAQFMSGFKDWTQMIYQLGLGAAAFKALGL
jgi:protein involved in polysaccharide export with SLBB domain